MWQTVNGSNFDTLLGKTKPSRRSRYRRWAAVAGGVVVLLLLISRCVPSRAPLAYETLAVERGDLPVTVTAVGNLAPTNEIVVGSQTSGLVDKVLVDVNDHVAAGQAVALIDTRRLDDTIKGSEAALSAQLASVAQQKATVRETAAQLARYREVSRLSSGRVPSQTEMTTAEAAALRAVAALRAAEAQVALARATLASDRTNREYAVIRSPVAGVVLSRQVDPGQTVAAQFNTPTLFTIAEDLRRMKLDVAVDEADVGQVRAGQPATFTVDAFPGRAFPATIRRVNLGATSATSSNAAKPDAGTVVSYTASLTVANNDLTLRPGMTATATIGVETARGALLVPNAALRYTPEPPDSADAGFKIAPPDGPAAPTRRERGIGRGSHQTVWVIGADSRPRAVSLTTGATDGRLTAVVSDDLRPGMLVITGVKAQPK